MINVNRLLQVINTLATSPAVTDTIWMRDGCTVCEELSAMAQFEPSDGITVATDFSGDQYEATYSIDGKEVCVAYVDTEGKPRVDFHELTHVGLAEFKRCLTVWVMSWAHAQEMSVLWRMSGADHAG